MFEAALNLLREERRAVEGVRAALMRDEDLRQSDPAHRDQLLVQTRAELAQITRAIALLSRVAAGELVEMEAPDAGPGFTLGERGPPPARASALIRRVQPQGGCR